MFFLNKMSRKLLVDSSVVHDIARLSFAGFIIKRSQNFQNCCTSYAFGVEVSSRVEDNEV